MTLRSIGLFFLFGVLAIAIVIIGTILSIVITFLIPFFMVFTGLWVVWFITREHSVSDSESKTE